jgi:hypothetical protein
MKAKVTAKECTHCRMTKPLSDYHRDKRWYMTVCKLCHNQWLRMNRLGFRWDRFKRKFVLRKKEVPK